MSVIRKVEVIRELWRAQARANGASEADIEGLNDTHVVSTLLAGATDAELQEFGGMPVDDKALEAMVDEIRNRKPSRK